NTKTVQETPLKENPEDTNLKFRYDLLSANHEHLKKLLIQYSSLLSQERNMNEKLEGIIRGLEDDIKFIHSLLKNSLIENGKLYNFNIELKPPRDKPTGDDR
ncbi:13223_t:CDS:2, partial [Funneliformis mosseae]